MSIGQLGYVSQVILIHLRSGNQIELKGVRQRRHLTGL